jgi:carbon-monoxide dehydrogenase small subunit
MTRQPVTELTIDLSVNGTAHEVIADVRTTLADMLRESLALTGTHTGCEHGVCGSCTVLVDGQPVRSCLVLGVQVGGRTVETIEGLANDGVMNALQQGFYERQSFQCGFCTPGFLMTVTALLADNRRPSRDEIREAISGNLCRCTGYQSIVDGVLRAVEMLDEQGRP